MEFTQSELWQRTLGNSEYGEPQERLRAAFLQFRQHVEPLASEVSQSVPGYTDHSIAHCDALWDTAGLIMGPAFPLNPAEAFVLGGSILIHDLAMGLAAYDDGLKGIFDSQSWRDLLWARWGTYAEVLQQHALEDLDRNPTWDGLTSPAVKESLTQFLRESHAARAEDILAREWHLTSGEPFFLLPDTELRHWYGELIGSIARSHWLDVSDLEQYLPGTRGTPSGLPLDWTVDPIKIACILRLADAAQIDARRAHPLHTPHRNPQGESREHWVFQERMLHPRIESSRLEFTSARAFSPEDADAWWLAYDTVAMIHKELQGVDALCADLGKPRMAARGAAGAEDPRRFARYVPTAGWQPIDARPHIENPLGIIESLGGEALYGRQNRVPLRELLANAVDASRARRAAQNGRTTVPAVQVRFEREPDVDVLHVRDFGIGMTAETIVDYLCNFGTSGWTSSAFRHEYPGALASGYASTGRFGIGFFSAFMLADRVRVVSRPLHGGWEDTHVLEFRNGIRSRPVLRRAEDEERLDEPGTEVSLWLNDRFDEPGSLLYAQTPMDSREQAALIEQLAFTSDQAIDLVPLGEEEPVKVTTGKQWQERSATEIYDALHSDTRIMFTTEVYEAGRDFFEQALTQLHGRDGSVVGKLAFRSRAGNDYMAAANCYCGGFEASKLYDLVGVAVGVPTRASRDRLRLDVEISQMQTWIHEHWKRIMDSTSYSDVDRMQFHWFALGFGVSLEKVPVAMTSGGLATADDVATWLATKTSFDIAQMDSGATVQLDNGQFWFSSWEGLLQLDGETIGVGIGQRRWNDEFPLPPCPEYSDWVENPSDAPTPHMQRWWYNHHYDPEAAVLRIAAETWNVSLTHLLDALQIAGIVDGIDTRPELRSFDGSGVRKPGLRILRTE